MTDEDRRYSKNIDPFSSSSEKKGYSPLTYFIIIVILVNALPTNIFWSIFVGYGFYHYFKEIHPHKEEKEAEKRDFGLDDEEELPDSTYDDQLDLVDLDDELEEIIAEKHKNHRYRS